MKNDFLEALVSVAIGASLVYLVFKFKKEREKKTLPPEKEVLPPEVTVLPPEQTPIPGVSFKHRGFVFTVPVPQDIWDKLWDMLLGKRAKQRIKRETFEEYEKELKSFVTV